MNLDFIRSFMQDAEVDYLLVNSTNKYLVEYNSLQENSRYKLTEFSGSTGDALVSQDACYLFVDGRYHIQADKEVDHNIVSVVKLQTGDTFLGEFVKKVKDNSVLGVFAHKNSMQRLELLKKELQGKNVIIKLLDNDPLDTNVDMPARKIIQIDTELCGLSPKEKLQELFLNLDENKGLLISNLEEVSYLTNLRSFSEQYTSKVFGKVFVYDNNAILFTDEEIDTVDGFEIKNPDEFEDFIRNLSLEINIYVDKSSVNAHDYFILGERAELLNDSPVKLMKSIKTDEEILHYKKAFESTDKTMFAIRDYIENSENLSEFDIAEQLEKYFYEFGAKSLSFKPIVAKDKNSALAHYSKSSQDEILKEGSLILIDCGAYYDGGLATDITRVFVKGEPSKLQKLVYTTVLKAFLNAFNYTTAKITGYDIDIEARKVFDENVLEGFVFNHGLGHGIGASVHEMPPNLSKNEIAKSEIKNNMCFTIEPGLYNQKHFGVRLENSCYLDNGKIKSFSKMCYEKKLIDYSLLNENEKLWLESFEVR